MEFRPFIPYLEDHWRGWTPFNGLQWEIHRQPVAHFPPGYAQALAENNTRAGYQTVAVSMAGGDEGFMSELHRHLGRLSHDWRWLDTQTRAASHNEINAGAQRENIWAWATDYLMWIGESYYPTPQDYIDEVWRLGASKRIPPSRVPRIIPGITKLYLIHPKAIPINPDAEGKASEYQAAIIGYVYLDRAIYVKPRHKKVPEKIQNWSLLGLLDIEEAGPVEKAPKVDRSQTDLLEVLEEEAEPDPPEYDPGPEIDDEGGMSEYRHQEPEEPWAEGRPDHEGGGPWIPPDEPQGEGSGEGVD